MAKEDQLVAAYREAMSQYVKSHFGGNLLAATKHLGVGKQHLYQLRQGEFRSVRNPNNVRKAAVKGDAALSNAAQHLLAYLETRAGDRASLGFSYAFAGVQLAAVGQWTLITAVLDKQPAKVKQRLAVLELVQAIAEGAYLFGYFTGRSSPQSPLHPLWKDREQGYMHLADELIALAPSDGMALFNRLQDIADPTMVTSGELYCEEEWQPATFDSYLVMFAAYFAALTFMMDAVHDKAAATEPLAVISREIYRVLDDRMKRHVVATQAALQALSIKDPRQSAEMNLHLKRMMGILGGYLRASCITEKGIVLVNDLEIEMTSLVRKMKHPMKEKKYRFIAEPDKLVDQSVHYMLIDEDTMTPQTIKAADSEGASPTVLITPKRKP